MRDQKQAVWRGIRACGSEVRRSATPRSATCDQHTTVCWMRALVKCCCGVYVNSLHGSSVCKDEREKGSKRASDQWRWGQYQHPGRHYLRSRRGFSWQKRQRETQGQALATHHFVCCSGVSQASGPSISTPLQAHWRDGGPGGLGLGVLGTERAGPIQRGRGGSTPHRPQYLPTHTSHAQMRATKGNAPPPWHPHAGLSIHQLDVPRNQPKPLAPAPPVDGFAKQGQPSEVPSTLFVCSRTRHTCENGACTCTLCICTSPSPCHSHTPTVPSPPAPRRPCG